MLVIGLGNTGGDVAVELSRTAAQVHKGESTPPPHHHFWWLERGIQDYKAHWPIAKSCGPNVSEKKKKKSTHNRIETSPRGVKDTVWMPDHEAFFQRHCFRNKTK